MLYCHLCNHQTRVLATVTQAGEAYRRRECKKCGYRFNTTETRNDAHKQETKPDPTEHRRTRERDLLKHIMEEIRLLNDSPPPSC